LWDGAQLLHEEGKGELMVSACVIATEPNARMAGIHNRMPVILPRTSWDLWLDPGAQVREVQLLLVPHPAERMAARPVGWAVGNGANDGPEPILPVYS
jgi:putative SOS response-associated peptidase YedK